MTDTVRALSALQTLLADNTSGDISPQDMRDAVVSGNGHLYGRVITSTSAALTGDDIVILADTSVPDADMTLTLPAASTSQYKVYLIRHGDASWKVTIAAAGSDTVHGDASIDLAGYETVLLWCLGTEWHMLLTVT